MAADQAQLAARLPAAPAVPSALNKFVKDCTAGTIGGVAVVAVGHPFGEYTHVGGCAALDTRQCTLPTD